MENGGLIWFNGIMNGIYQLVMSKSLLLIAMTIEIISGFFPLNMVIFHSYVSHYQRVDVKSHGDSWLIHG